MKVSDIDAMMTHTNSSLFLIFKYNVSSFQYIQFFLRSSVKLVGMGNMPRKNLTLIDKHLGCICSSAIMSDFLIMNTSLIMIEHSNELQEIRTEREREREREENCYSVK